MFLNPPEIQRNSAVSETHHILEIMWSAPNGITCVIVIYIGTPRLRKTKVIQRKTLPLRFLNSLWVPVQPSSQDYIACGPRGLAWWARGQEAFGAQETCAV